MGKSARLAFFLLFVLIPAALYAGDITLSFKGHEKMDVSLTQSWRRAMETGDIMDEATCIVKLRRPVNDETVKSLRQAGFITETRLNTIITGRVRFGDLPELVRLDDVVYVEKEKELNFK